MTMQTAQNIQDDFKSRMEIDPETGCWNWKKLGEASEYGQFRSHLAHRFSWTMHWGPIPEGIFVCHDCDNKRCVNPFHLFLGTAFDNAVDRYKKKLNWMRVIGVWDFLKQPGHMEKYGRNSRLISALVSGVAPINQMYWFAPIGIDFDYLNPNDPRKETFSWHYYQEVIRKARQCLATA
jgi:hypothetical protein